MLFRSLSLHHAKIVTAAMHQRLRKVKWLPKATQTAMWTTSHATGSTMVSLPRGKAEFAPVVIANPRSAYGRSGLARFRLRDVAEGGED